MTYRYYVGAALKLLDRRTRRVGLRRCQRSYALRLPQQDLFLPGWISHCQCQFLSVLSQNFGDVIRREVCRVGFDQRNPKPETRNGLLKLVSNCETRNPKPETRNPKPTLRTYFPKDRSKPETRNPKPETRKLVSSDETRNPKPETDSESWFQSTKPETRNPKPETDSNPTFGWLSGSELKFWVPNFSIGKMIPSGYLT